MAARTTTDPLHAGWRELKNARWRDARASFERVVSDRDSAEAWEGLSWAAWWLDDEEAVFHARERAFDLYQQGGAPGSAARMAIWLTVDELDFRGAYAVASGWLGRARRLLDPLPPCPEHGWLAFHEGYLAYAGGDTARAGDLAAHAAEMGRALDVADLEMLGCALEGATLVARARVDEGMSRLDEATATALATPGTIPISSAWTFCFLVGACMATLDFERASEWCDRIAEFADRYGSRYMLAFCRAEYGAVHLWRGRWVEAERVLEAAVEDFAASRPAWVGGSLVTLAELRRRQGRPADAAELLERAGGSSGAHLCHARLALDAGDTRESVERTQRLLRQLPDDRLLGRAPALALLVHAHCACGEVGDAASAIESLRAIEARVGTPALTACADLAEGALALASGDPDRARALTEDALDGFERCGAPFDAAEGRVQLAACLSALGRAQEAAAEEVAARERLADLGAAPPSAAAREPGSLTPREAEVLGLIAEGLTNRQIAERLVVSEHTVHRHVTNLLRKLGLPTRAAAAAYAARFGLLERTPG